MTINERTAIIHRLETIIQDLRLATSIDTTWRKTAIDGLTTVHDGLAALNNLVTIGNDEQSGGDPYKEEHE